MINAESAKGLKDLNDAADSLKLWRRNRSAVENRIYFRHAEELKKETGRTAEEWLESADFLIPVYERACSKLFDEYNPKLTPLFDTLYYLYDYGDDWCVKITVLDQYDRKTNADLSTCGAFVVDIMKESDGLRRYRYFQDGKEVDEELRHGTGIYRCETAS